MTPIPTPTSTAAPSPVAIVSPEPTTTPPPATPNGTISIGCFLAVQGIVDNFRGLDAQIAELPRSERDVLGTYVDNTKAVVVSAPVGCFTDDELQALENFWAYAATTRPRDLSKVRIEELLAAVGIPYPTPHP